MPDPTPVRVPEGARWSCRECGGCCRLFQLGPVEPAIVAGLEARDVGAAWAPAAAGFVDRRDTPAGPELYLRKVDGACVFLQPDNRCAVHRLYGAEAKPAFCREFPFHLVEDDLGLALVARGECGGFYASSADGAPMESYVAEVLALPRPRGIPKFSPENVTIVAGLEVSRARWMELEARLLTALAAAPGGETPQPEALVALARSTLFAAEGVRGPTPDRAKFTLALRALLQAIRMVLDHVLSTESGAPAEVAFTRRLRDHLSTAEARVHDPIVPLAPEAARHQGLLVRSTLLAKGFQGLGGVGPGLGLFLFNSRFAQLAAGAGAEGTVGAAEHSAVYAAFVRLTLNATLHRVLLSARPALVDLFIHAGA